MDKIDDLLHYVQKTNPGMTREKLIDELNKSDYAAKATWKAKSFTKAIRLRTRTQRCMTLKNT